jgi:hypothetical protein
MTLGYFPIATLWIFHLTFGKLGLYLITNLINNLVFCFGIIPILEKINFIKWVKFTRIHHFIVAMVYSLILYGYELFFDKTNSTNLRFFNKRVLK